GPVGMRVAGLLGRLGARVTITSRDGARAKAAAARIADRFGVRPGAVVLSDSSDAPIAEAELMIAAGPAGTRLVSRRVWTSHPGLRVIADVNAVPPGGIEGVEPADDGVDREGGVRAYGALAIGGLKMKLHKACIAELFERNDRVLDAEAIYDLAADL
ncbi:MAG: methylenetetrahydrofolate dehydrogenase, partial [Longimicrobiales bacterium]